MPHRPEGMGRYGEATEARRRKPVAILRPTGGARKLSMLSRPGSKQIDILGYGEDPNQSPKVVARLPFDMEAIIRPERPLNLLASLSDANCIQTRARQNPESIAREKAILSDQTAFYPLSTRHLDFELEVESVDGETCDPGRSVSVGP